MNKTDNLCINCWSELTAGAVCTECGYDNDKPNDMEYMDTRCVLNGRYVIGTVMSRESDAVIYSAYDTVSNCRVILREFMPKGIAGRLEGNNDVHIREKFKKHFETYKMSFINLWNTLQGMRNLSAVIPVNDVFEEHGTAYAVSEYMENMPLREFLLKTPEGNIQWDRARLMFMPVLTTLENLHTSGIIHGSITPDNLVLCRDGKVRLKGFCIMECNNVSSELEFNLNEGYTAIEQYDNNHKMCPATDIYAFSACIYRALVGTNPPDAPSREVNDKLMIPNRIAEAIPTHVIKALGYGLQIYPEKRCQSVSRYRELLNASPNVVAAAAPVVAPTPQTVVREPAKEPQKAPEPVTKKKNYDDDDKSKKNKIVIGVLVILIVAAIAAGIYVVKFSGLVGSKEETTNAVSLASYTVPDFVSAGYTQSDVENNGAWNSQFKITYTQEYSTSVEEGIIFAQSVDSGKEVEEGTEVILTVSKGVQTEEIPDVGGLTLDEATKQLTAKGFKVSSVEIYNDSTGTPKTVKSNYGMAPAAGTTVAVGSEVILQVYGEVATTTTTSTTEATTSDPIVEGE